LSADVTSSAGTVNEGTVTFTVLDSNGNTVGTVSGTVTSGAATANFTLPAAQAAGSYTIQAVYTDSSSNFLTSTSSGTATLTVAPAATTTSATTPSAASSSQPVTLTATVETIGAEAAVNEGTVAFTVFDSAGNTVTTGSGSVSSGSASTSLTLSAGTYTFAAVYTDSLSNYVTSTGSSGEFTLS
jgi:hypothetical protein